MKKLSTLIVFSCVSLFGFAQVTITPNQTAAQIVNSLVATSGTLGVVVSNQTLVCDSTANAEFTGPSNLGMTNGVILANGELFGANGLLGNPSVSATGALGTSGDADLTILCSNLTYDACVLEFDLQPVGSFVEFEYIFGSDEYPAFNCSSFNDIFAFIISGPGIASPTNIALVPGTTTPVSINSINDQSTPTCGDSTYYVTNTDTVFTMNGFTTPLLAYSAVTPGQTYHLKLAIADASDQILNSYVFLRSNSLKTGNTNPNGLAQVNVDSQVKVFPTSFDETVTIKNLSHSNWSINVMNVNGQIVYHSQMNASNDVSNLKLGHLNTGMYFLQMTNNEGQVLTKKVVKN
jgi:hypothetical protein